MSGKPHPIPVAALPAAMLVLIGCAFFLNTAAASLADTPAEHTEKATLALVGLVIPAVAGIDPRWPVHQTNSSPDPHMPPAMPRRDCDSVNI